MTRKGKITSSFSVSRLADENIEKMVDSGGFSSKSALVETLIIERATEMGMRPSLIGGTR